MENQPPTNNQFLSKDAKKRTHSVYGKVSLICGIIAFVLFFVYPLLIDPLLGVLFPLPPSNSFNNPFGYLLFSRDIFIKRYLIPIFSLAILAIIFGALTFLIKKPKDDYGKIGLFLGCIDIIIAYIIFTIMYYVCV
jgi:hypothetical protein